MCTWSVVRLFWIGLIHTHFFLDKYIFKNGISTFLPILVNTFCTRHQCLKPWWFIFVDAYCNDAWSVVLNKKITAYSYIGKHTLENMRWMLLRNDTFVCLEPLFFQSLIGVCHIHFVNVLDLFWICNSLSRSSAKVYPSISTTFKI